MLSIEKQIQSKRLVCPVSHQCLEIQGDRLVTKDGSFSYPFVNNVPILIQPEKQNSYLTELDSAMAATYSNPNTRARVVQFFERLSIRGGDYRLNDAIRAFQDIIDRQTEDSLCISIGGGPLRLSEKLVNVNIDAFQNVDVVADAYQLPYATNSVDAIYCEAVLEHLEFPEKAVNQMFRVLQNEGRVFAATPFLQAFHGFPNHYQNFTQVGHERLFARAGFKILNSNVCVGPTFALTDLLIMYSDYVPSFCRAWARCVALLLSAIVRPLDHRLNTHPNAHVMASTTYLVAAK